MATTRKTSTKTNQAAKKNPSPSKNSAKNSPAKSAASKKEAAEAKPAGVAAQSKRAAQPSINHELIERTAYFIWEEKGRPHGREEENWLEAESRLLHRPR